MNYLKDYVAEFYRCDFQLAYLFKTKTFLAMINYKLPEADILAEGAINEPVLGYVYFKKEYKEKGLLPSPRQAPRSL